MTPDQLAKSGSEHAHQRALFAWANMCAKHGVHSANQDSSYTIKGAALWNRDNLQSSIPELELLFAIHNQGHGDAIRGARAKAEGVKAGVPDLMLPVPAFLEQGAIIEYNGLFIEMKKPKVGITSSKQNEVFDKLEQQGYKVVVCYGWQDARDTILQYLGKL